MKSNPTSNVSIIAIAVSSYQNMRELPGTITDIYRLKELLVESDETALFKEDQFTELIDPTAEDFRNKINNYVADEGNQGNVLIFYFSGHGVPIGRNDFGFCTIDSQLHPKQDRILPLSVVKFSDLLNTLSISNITPIIIIDACYSGIVGRAMGTSPSEVISIIKDEIHTQNASKYALLTSCTEFQETDDTPNGGIFSHYLIDIANNPRSSGTIRKRLLSLKDIFPELEERVTRYSEGNVTPRLYLGSTLPDFPLVVNSQYDPISYSLTGHLIKVLDALWNNGNERLLTTADIDRICGKGAYGNHSKLSYEQWELVEDGDTPRTRRLSKKGEKFMQGKLEVPRTIEKDPKSGKYIPANNTAYVNIRAAKK